MASNNYTSANIVPAADTFREWVDLTNRITYDMEKIVVTVAANTQGARTSGNASVNGYFSANTLIVEQEMRGAKATSTIYGTKAASANLVIVSNTVFKANASHASIIHAQANVHHTGALFEASSNVNINSTSTTFTSNAGTNIFNTPVDVNANMDVDNSLTHITSTLTDVDGGSLNVNSNSVIDANTIQLKGGTVTSSSNVNINSTATTFTSNAATNIFNTPMDINANIDADNNSTHITSALTDLDGGNLNINSNTILDANTAQFKGGLVTYSSNVSINSTATSFISAAHTNRFSANAFFDANVMVGGASLRVGQVTGNVTTFTVDGTTIQLSSTTTNIHGQALDVSSNSVFQGDVRTDANTIIGNAGSDLLTVNANTVLNDELKVVKDVDLDAALNVDGATTLNGAITLGDATSDDISYSGRVATGITPKANGTLSIGTSTLRWDGQFDDLVADDLTVDDDAGIGGDLTVSGAGTVDGVLTVNTALSVTYPGSTRTIIAGAGVTDSDRMIIKSQVGNTTFGLMPLQGNNVPLGNNTNRWVITGTTGTFSSNLDIEGDIDVNGTSNLDIVDIDGATDMASTLSVGDLATFNQGTTTSGIANVATFNASGPAGFNEPVTVSNTVAAGNTSITGTLGVSLATTLSSTLAAGSTTITGTLGATGDVDFDSDLNVDGNIVVDGNAQLGTTTSDTITVPANVTRMVPSANGNALGITTKRWAGMLSTLNASGLITAGGSINIGSEANTSTLLVNSTSAFKGNSTWSRTGTTGDLTITANTTQHNMGIGGIVCANLVVSGTATLPSDTSLTLSTVSGKVFNVADTINLGTGANAVTTVIFGSGAGSGTTANIIFTDAEFSTTFTPRLDNTIDIGTSSKGFRTGYFDTSLVVGNTTVNGTQVTVGANTTIGYDSIQANNIYATDDLIGKYSSDQQLKDNVLVIDTALNKINNISGYSFTWNQNIGDMRTGTNDYGVLAQEIEEILPDAVSINGRGYKTVNYNALIPLLVEAVKELSAKVDYYMNAEGEEEDG